MGDCCYLCDILTDAAMMSKHMLPSCSYCQHLLEDEVGRLGTHVDEPGKGILPQICTTIKPSISRSGRVEDAFCMLKKATG